MELLSVQVGLPRELLWQGRRVTTGIFKEPVIGPVTVRMLNLDGDAQADLSVHGGPDKAVYAYPVEHYEYWRRELPGMELPHGMFGENFTTRGLLEKEVHIGDRFRVGGAELVVRQPRMPCYKLAIKFGRPDILKQFLASRRSGFYFAVLREGEVQPGDKIERLSHDSKGLSVEDIVRVYGLERDDLDTLRRAVRDEALPDSWRSYFQHQLEKYDAG